MSTLETIQSEAVERSLKMAHLKPVHVRILVGGLVAVIVVLRLMWPVSSATALVAALVIGSLLAILLIHLVDKFLFRSGKKPQGILDADEIVGADEPGGHGEGRLSF